MRNRPGRPPAPPELKFIKVGVSLPPKAYAKLQALGSGNVSLGIRAALAYMIDADERSPRYRTTKPKKETP